jgi:hypothetical protein
VVLLPMSCDVALSKMAPGEACEEKSGRTSWNAGLLVDSTEIPVSVCHHFCENVHTSVSVLSVHLCISENGGVWVWGWCPDPFGPRFLFLPGSGLVFHNTRFDMAFMGTMISREQLPAARTIVVVRVCMCCNLLASPLRLSLSRTGGTSDAHDAQRYEGRCEGRCERGASSNGAQVESEPAMLGGSERGAGCSRICCFLSLSYLLNTCAGCIYMNRIVRKSISCIPWDSYYDLQSAGSPKGQALWERFNVLP